MTGYSSAVIGLLVLSLIPVALAGVAGPVKGRAGLPGGPVRGDEASRVFRIDRAHLNAVETLASFTVPAVLAMMMGLDGAILGALVWGQVLVRLVYTGVYLRGGPLSRGGSLRTVLFVLSAIITFLLIFATAWSALI